LVNKKKEITCFPSFSFEKEKGMRRESERERERPTKKKRKKEKTYHGRKRLADAHVIGLRISVRIVNG
jgi:hypothetical protein